MAFTPRTEEYADAASLSSPYDLTVYKPTGTAEGDILFALLCWYATVTIDSVPSGWTLLGDYTTNTDRYALYYKVAGASEPSTYTWSFTGNTKARITCSCYTGGDFNPSDPIAVYSNTPYPISDQYVKAASMSVPSANSPLVFWAGVYRIASATFIKPSAPSSDWVEDDDAGSTGSDFWAEVCSMIWAGSGNTGDMIATCTAILAAKHAFAVALKPAGGPIQYGSATMSGTGTLAALARTTQVASATLSGAGSLAALARLIKYGAATLSGTGSLSAAGTLAGAPLTASATLSGAGALAAMARAIRRATATLSGLGTLTATATVSLAGVMTATLLAAQKKPHRIPYVEAKVYDYEAGIKRLTWTRLYTGSEPDNHHGIAFDGQGSMHRIRAAAGYKLYYQKFTSPDEHSDYSSWALIASDCDGPCAIAASGARVYIFYRDTDNTLRKYYSHNYGVDWTNAELIPYTEVVSLAACWWGTGNIVVCFAIKSSYPAELNGVVLDTSDQGTTQHEWHDTNHPLLDTYGIGATYNPFWPAIEIVLAGKESDTPYHHFDLFRTKFSNTYNLLGLESFLMAPDGENITYQYPDCHLPTGALEHETNRIVAVEKFVGTTAYTRPITCHMVKGTYWSDTTFTEPRPFLDLSPSYGLRIASTSAYWWIEKPDGVWTAPRPAGDPLDLTRDIVSMVQSVPGTLVLELNNSKGQYALPGEGALASLRFRAEIQLRLGYRTTEGPEAMPAGTYWIDSWQYSHDPNISRFTITCLDGAGLMDRWTARYQMRWNKDEVGPKSVWQILYQLLARVGICLTNTPSKPQSSAINNFYPDFAISPGSNGTTAVNRLLSFVPDKLAFRGQEAFTKNPLATEDSCYSYGPDHVITTGRYSHAVTLSRSRALGQAGDDSRIVQDALDWALLALSIDIPGQDYDPNLTTTTRAQERADAILRTQQTQSTPATIVVPTNVGQELLDVVAVTDVRCGILETKYRVEAIRTDYDRSRGLYDHKLTLGAP